MDISGYQAPRRTKPNQVGQGSSGPRFFTLILCLSLGTGILKGRQGPLVDCQFALT